MKLFVEASLLERFQTLFAGEIIEWEPAQNGRLFHMQDPMLLGRFSVGTSLYKREKYIEVGRFPEAHKKTNSWCQWADPMPDSYPVGSVATLTERGFNILLPRVQQ